MSVQLPLIDEIKPACYTLESLLVGLAIRSARMSIWKFWSLPRKSQEKSKTSPLQLRLYAEAMLPTVFGDFLLSVYRDQNDEEGALLISKDLEQGDSPFIRVHSECYTGEVLGSLKCDCRDQLNLALQEIQKRGCGAVVYLRQEGRGIGLGNKVRAYHLQNQGANTIEANHQLGFASDLRSFEAAGIILQARGVHKIVLNTNNPDKIKGLQDAGIAIVERIPSLPPLNPHNEDYLRTKMLEMGHDLSPLFSKKEPR